MSDDVKFRRKSIACERRLTFLLQSFALDEADLDKAESQLVEMEDLLQQLSRNNELLASAEPEHFNEHRQAFFQLNEQVRGLKDRIIQMRNRERLLSGALSKEPDQVSIEMKALLDARDSVHKSQSMANEFLEETYATKDAVRAGNDGLRRIRDRSTGIGPPPFHPPCMTPSPDRSLASTYQSASDVLNSIRRQTAKHTVAMGLCFGLGFAFLLWWYLSR